MTARIAAERQLQEPKTGREEAQLVGVVRAQRVQVTVVDEQPGAGHG